MKCSKSERNIHFLFQKKNLLKIMINSLIQQTDRVLTMIYRNYCLASYLQKREWERELDRALDERLVLMKMRDESV